MNKDYLSKKAMLGEWVNEEYDAHFMEYRANCSVCGYESTDSSPISENHRYCEHCGSRMKGNINHG